MDMEMTVKRAIVDPSPNYDELKAFEVPPVPEGTHVEYGQVDDKGNEVATGVRYVWKDGSVQPAHDPETVERIRRRAQELRRERGK